MPTSPRPRQLFFSRLYKATCAAARLHRAGSPQQQSTTTTKHLLTLLLAPATMAAASDAPAAAAHEKRTLVFTYGTLKRGFSNHTLLESLSTAGDAAFVGAATTTSPLPLVCGPYRVPFLLNLPGAGHRVAGELYAVTPRGLARLDELEGVARAHYERLPVSVQLAEGASVDALAYFAHRSYAGELWRRSGEKGYGEYSHAVAEGYVRRKDRPQDVTFLEQIRIFCGVVPGQLSVSDEIGGPVNEDHHHQPPPPPAPAVGA